MGNVELDEGALGVPAVISGSPRIYVQAIEAIVEHYFEYVAVAADKELCSGLTNHLRDPGLIAARVSPYMGHKYRQSLCFKLLDQRKIAFTLPMVDIAVDSADRRAHFFKSTNHVDATNVAGMPDFVAVGKMESKPVVPTAVGVGQYPDTFHKLDFNPIDIDEKPKQGGCTPLLRFFVNMRRIFNVQIVN